MKKLKRKEEPVGGAEVFGDTTFAMSAPEPVPQIAWVLVEGPDGGLPVDGPCTVAPGERCFVYAGVSYEHVHDHADGRWIYRAM